MKRFNKKNLIRLVLIILTFLNFSCKKEREPEKDIFKEYSQEIFNSNFLSIYGDWELKDANIVDPFDLLIIYKIGKFKLIKDEEILSEGKIFIDTQTDTSLFIDLYPYMYIPNGTKGVIMKGNDSLYLYDTCNDCYSYFFIRKK